MTKSSDIELTMSEDGSHTIYVPALDEHYHSIHGAIQESMHVYIKTGLEQCTQKHINILEIGFGTGLNALLTKIHSQGRFISYQTVEKYPLGADITDRINYGTELNEADFYEGLHRSPWNEWCNLTPGFSIHKWSGDFRDIKATKGVDLVYFDAFGPEKQPDLWSKEVFTTIYDLMNEGGIFVTYCAKGAVRRLLQECGLEVERLPGPPYKREILRGWKR